MAELDLVMLSNEIFIYSALLLKLFNQSVDERLQSLGVPMSSLQLSILRMLQHETLTVSTISERLGMDPSTIVRTVDALERKSLAVRGVDPDDRRRNPIEISQEGLELIHKVPVVTETDHSFQALQSIGIESVLQLRELLLKVIKEFPEGKLVSELMSGMPGPEIESKDEPCKQ
jgi:DNA-binding MarR family transcriptional regulator